MEWTQRKRDMEADSEGSSLMEEELSQGDEGRKEEGELDGPDGTREPATVEEDPATPTPETDKSKVAVRRQPNALEDAPVQEEEEKVDVQEEEEEVEIKSTDMDEAKVLEAVRVAKEALQVDKLEKAVAETVKKHFDVKYGVNWHCIVGQSFGSFVTHREGAFLYAYVGKYAILLYKT
uniref:Dynein light chain n=1 Tax=Picocystis salinarum TaxID=88271 RepID=A0A7S3UA45_9CHLO|mmetsp:Transcript_8765/g.53908  ORF Transcript_8765/g.53908 Transcript_8765/m.53908 type:complete len:178 (-) Transcript_8765:1024-1557(-)